MISGSFTTYHDHAVASCRIGVNRPSPNTPTRRVRSRHGRNMERATKAKDALKRYLSVPRHSANGTCGRTESQQSHSGWHAELAAGSGAFPKRTPLMNAKHDLSTADGQCVT